MATSLRSILGIKEGQDIASVSIRGQKDFLEASLHAQTSDAMFESSGRGGGSRSMRLSEDDEHVYLRAHAAEERIRRHRAAVQLCAPGDAQLGVLQLLSILLIVALIVNCFCGSQPGLWAILLLLFLAPEKVYRVPSHHVERQHASCGVAAASPKRRKRLVLALSPIVNGTDPRGTVHLCRRQHVLLCMAYLGAYLLAASIFQLVLAANTATKSTYRTSYDAWRCSISWYNATSLSNLSQTPSPLLGANCSSTSGWSWPPFETFGLWDADVDMSSFLWFYIPSTVTLVIAVVLWRALPSRYYYGLDDDGIETDSAHGDGGRGGHVAALPLRRPLAMRQLEQGLPVSPSARPVARASAVTASCLPVVLAAAVLPGMLHAIPLLLATAYALTATLAPPEVRNAQAPCDLLPVEGETAPRRCYFPVWGFRPSDDRATRVRSWILTALYVSCALIITAQCVWQSPLFDGWNELAHRREGFTDTAFEWSLDNRDADRVNMWFSTMQSSWYREIGLYHMRSFVDLASRHSDEAGASTSTRIVDVAGASLDSFVASADNGGVSIAARVVVQMVFYVVALLWLRRAPASVYQLPNPPTADTTLTAAGGRLARQANYKDNAQRSFLFHTAAAKALDHETHRGTVLCVGNDSTTNQADLNVGVSGLLGAIMSAVSRRASAPGGRAAPQAAAAAHAGDGEGGERPPEHADDESGEPASPTADAAADLSTNAQEAHVAHKVLDRLHVVLEATSKAMLRASPWVSVLCLSISVIAVPCVATLLVTLPAAVFLASGPHPILLTARVSAVAALLLALHLCAIVLYISSHRIRSSLVEPYDHASWWWYVILGQPYAMSLAEYSFLVVCLGSNVVILVLSFLRCVDSEVATDLREEEAFETAKAQQRHRDMANNVKDVLAQESLPLTMRHIAQVAPEIGHVLHPFHRALLLGTSSDETMETLMSEVWRFGHLIQARQRIGTEEWQLLLDTWAAVDAAETVVTMRMVSEEGRNDPLLRSTWSHSLPFEAVRRRVLVRLPSVRWLITQEELVLMLHILDRALPPSDAVRAAHWQHQTLYVEDVALMVAVWIDGSRFLRPRGKRLSEHLPPLSAKPDPQHEQQRTAPSTSGAAPSTCTEEPMDDSLQDLQSTSLNDEVDRNDAWRLLRVFRAVYNNEMEAVAAEVQGGSPGAAGGADGATDLPNASLPNPSSLFGSLRGSTDLVNALRRSMGANHTCVPALGPDAWEPVLTWLAACAASPAGGWRLRVVNELIRTKVQQGNPQAIPTASTNTSPAPPTAGSHHAAVAAGGPHAMVEPDALPMLHVQQNLQDRILRVVLQSVAVLLSVLWHTLALSSFVTAMILFFTASYRRSYNTTQTLLLVCSVALVLCSGSSSSRVRHGVVLLCSVTVLVALVATMVGTIFRYAFADAASLPAARLRDATYTDVHDNLFVNLGIASVQDSPWELGLYLLTFLFLQLQRYAYGVEQAKDRFLAHIHAQCVRQRCEPFHQSNEPALCAEEQSSRYAVPPVQASSSPPSSGTPATPLAVSWDFVQQSIRWRLLSSSAFFAKLQFYLAIVVIAMLYVSIVGFSVPTYVSCVLLVLYLVVAISGSIHHRSLESRWFPALLVVVGSLCALVVLGFGVFHIPAVRYAIREALVDDCIAHNGAGFVGARCGFTIFQGGNETLTMGVVAANTTAFAERLADACTIEIGFMKSNENDNLGSTVVAYFFAVMFCAVEYWLLSRFRQSLQFAKDETRRRMLERQQKEAVAADAYPNTSGITPTSKDTSTVELVQTSPFLSVLHRSATFVVFVTQHNLQKVLWLANIYAAVAHVSLLSLPYLAFFMFDVSGAIPIIYAALHLVAVHGYDLTAIPVFWSAEGLRLIGLPKRTAYVNVLLNITSNVTATPSTTHVHTEAAPVWDDAARALLVAPTLVLAFNLLAKNTASIMKAAPMQRRTAGSGGGRADDNDDLHSNPEAGADAASPSSPTSVIRRLLLAIKVLAVCLYGEMIRGMGWELLSLTFLIGIAVNPIRFVQVVLVVSWIVVHRFIGRDAFVRSALAQRVLMGIYATLMVGTVILGLRIPQRGSDPLEPGALTASRGLGDSVYIGQAFFWPSSYLVALYGVSWERFSYARYAGAQPTTALFWTYGIVICVLKILMRDRPYHMRHPRRGYALRGRAFDSCVVALRVLQRPINMARTHLIRLFVLLKPVPQATPEVPSADSSARAAVSTPSLRSRGAVAFLVGRGGSSAMLDARAAEWEDALVEEERQCRRSMPLHERLHANFCEHGMVLFTALKFLVFAYLPMHMIFGDANENESLLHTVLMVVALRLLLATLDGDAHWRPHVWMPRVLAFYQGILVVTVLCNVPTIAEFIEKYSQPFRALGMTHRESYLEETGKLSTTETTMALTAWRVAAVWVCLLQERLQRSFMYLGAMASLQDASIDGRDVHAALLGGVSAQEDAEKAMVLEQGRNRSELLRELHAAINAPAVVVVGDGQLPGGGDGEMANGSIVASEATTLDVLSGTLANRLHALGGPEHHHDHHVEDDEVQGGGEKASSIERWTQRIENLTWQHADNENKSAQDQGHSADSQQPRANAVEPGWQRLLAAVARLLVFRIDALVFALVAANFLQSGSLLDALPLLGVLVAGLTWHPWVTRTMVVAGMQLLMGIVLLKTVTRFVVGQTVLLPNAARLLGAIVVQMPADGSLLTVSASGATTKSRESNVALLDVGLDFASLVAIWLYLRMGELYGLFVVPTNVVHDATDSESDGASGSSSDSDDGESNVSWTTDAQDTDVLRVAMERRQAEIASLEADIKAYETSLAERKQSVLDREGADGWTAALEEGEAMDANTLIDLVRGVETRRLLPFAPTVQAAASQGDGDEASSFVADAVASIRENMERKAGTGTDVYTYSAVLEFACLIYIAFAYHTLAGINGNFVGSIIDNLLPGWLVLWLILSTLVMAVDRAIYVYSATAFHRAQRLKLVLHVCLSLFYTIFYIAWSATRATDHSAAAGGCLMALKLLTLCVSAYQIKMGFPTFRRHDPMTTSTTWELPYTVYRAVPFLWEIRMLIDWTFTQTTLQFRQYLRVEDVHHEIYDVYCNKDDDPEHRGALLTLPSKLGRGCGVFFLVLLIIFFPMLYYSTFNPILANNLITGAVLTVETDQFGVLYEATATTSGSTADDTTVGLDLLYPSLRSAGFLSSNAAVQVLDWNACSLNRWATTTPLRQSLVERWASYANASGDDAPAAPELNIRVSLDRERGLESEDGSSTTSGTVQYGYTLSRNQAYALALAVNQTVYPESTSATINATDSVVGSSRLANLILPFVKNTGGGYSIESLGRSTSLPSPAAYSCTLSLHAETTATNASSNSSTDTRTGNFYWCMGCQPIFSISNSVATELAAGSSGGTVPADYACLVTQRPSVCAQLGYEDWGSASSLDKPYTSPPYAVVASQMIPETSALPINVGIIALYATLILSLANMLRDSMSGNATRAMLEEMHNPKPLAELLTYLFMCRGGGDDVHLADPVLEEALFLELVDLLRAPEVLRKATGLRAASYDANGDRIPVKMQRMW